MGVPKLVVPETPYALPEGIWYTDSAIGNMVRLSDGRRRNLDYSEAQSFQDLLLRRSLRGIGDELHAGLAGSSRISV